MTLNLDLQPFTLDGPSEPPRRRWSPMLLTQLVVILAVLVAGVTGAALRGHDDDGKDVLSIVKAASATAAAQKTMRATYEFRLSGSGLDVTSTGSMVSDNARRLATGTITAPGLGEIDLRSVAGVSYLQLPNGRADASGHHWVSFRSLQPGTAVGGQDPMAFLNLVGDPEKVEDLGEQKVNGVQTTHYRVHIDPARLSEGMAKSGANITVPPGTFEQMKDAAAELWIDDDNLPRRMSMSMGIQQVKGTFRFDFFDYGKPVEVTAPDSSDVTEVASPLEIGRILSEVRTG
ncbi:MAG: hypothetical protein QOE05_3592 [Actinomycetota bacterium]|nr:hypothetical protein [Actinomycetota bacterium]